MEIETEEQFLKRIKSDYWVGAVSIIAWMIVACIGLLSNNVVLSIVSVGFILFYEPTLREERRRYNKYIRGRRID
jgi:hypothetical protein